MNGTAVSDSTLLITVGRPNSPWCAGSGGFARTSPRLPSRLSRSEVSSRASTARRRRTRTTSSRGSSPTCTTPTDGSRCPASTTASPLLLLPAAPLVDQELHRRVRHREEGLADLGGGQRRRQPVALQPVLPGVDRRGAA